MAYKVSGNTAEDSRILVIKESDWSVETTESGLLGEFELTGLTEGSKIVVARNSLGSIVAFGGLSPVEDAPTGGDRGVFGGGNTVAGSPYNTTNTIDYITISNTTDATDFGDMIAARGASSVSNSANDRGLFGSQCYPNYSNIIDYVTISSAANALDFGDLTQASFGAASASNGVNNRGVFAGGSVSGSGDTNTISHVSIASLNNASDFGDLTISITNIVGTSNGTNGRGVFAGGNTGGTTSHNIIDYITIASNGDASSFGDILTAKYGMAATSNLTNSRGVFGGGYSYTNVVEYINIFVISNASDFGDLTTTSYFPGACSNGTNERGVFGGGRRSSPSVIADYITINSTGNSISFGNLTIGREALDGCSNS